MSKRLLLCGNCGNRVPLPENRQVPSMMCSECYHSIPVAPAARLSTKGTPLNVSSPQSKLPPPPGSVKKPISVAAAVQRCRSCQQVLTGKNITSGTCPACTNTVTAPEIKPSPPPKGSSIGVSQPQSELPPPPGSVKKPVSVGSPVQRCKSCNRELTSNNISSGTCPSCANTVTAIGAKQVPSPQGGQVSANLIPNKMLPPGPVKKPPSNESLPRCRSCQCVLTGDNIKDTTCPACTETVIFAGEKRAQPEQVQLAPSRMAVAIVGEQTTVSETQNAKIAFPRFSFPRVSGFFIANRGRVTVVGLAIMAFASMALLVASMKPSQQTGAAPLDFVRTDSELLLHFRVADIWNSWLIQDFYGRLPEHVRRQSEETVSRVGIGMEFIDSVTITFTNPQQPALCAVVKTNRKYTTEDQKKILSSTASAASVKWETHKHRGLTYYVGNGHAPGTPDTPLAVYTATENLFVLGTESGVTAALDSYLDSHERHTLRQSKAKSTANSVAMLEWLRPWIDNPDYLFVAAGARSSNVNEILASLADPRTSDVARQRLTAAPAVGGLLVNIRPDQPIPTELKKLLAADSAMIAMKVDTNKVLHIHGRSHFPSAKEAKEGEELLRGLLSAMRIMPEGAERLPEGHPQVDLLRKLTTFLRAVKVESDDQFVSFSAKQELPSLVQDIQGGVDFGTTWYNHEMTGAPNLKQLANAFELYHAQHGRYPPAQVMNTSGTEPLYSWRVAILPYLGEEAAQLYREFHKNESWASPHNQSLSQKMPSVFEHPLARMRGYRTSNIKGVANGMTPYQLPVGLAAAFFEDRSVSKRDIADGLDQTVMILEQQPLVPWTAPIDVSVSADQIQNLLKVPSPVPGAPLETVLFDQTTLQIDRSMKPDRFWGMINPKDGLGTLHKSP